MPEWFQPFMILGVYIYGALAISGGIATALVFGDRYAALAFVASAGFAYAAQMAAAFFKDALNIGFLIASLAAGVGGFIHILGQ